MVEVKTVAATSATGTRVRGSAGNTMQVGIFSWRGDSAEAVSVLNPPMPAVTNVSSRQLKLQLLAAGLLDEVDPWISMRPRAMLIAYEYSGTFVRAEPMLADGFAAMGSFFTAAAEI